MNIEIQSTNETLSERMRRYVETMTREVLRGFETRASRVVVRVWRDTTAQSQRRFHCALRVDSGDGHELIFDGTATHPHVAVERALEQLWQVVRTRKASTDGRAA
jgi:ribosome-associated translation inhibitor RaiA